MAIKGRQTLYSIFVNEAIPTQSDYRDLIDSTLNRRDDCFFGEWQKGRKYCTGDVVVYGKSLYKLIKLEEEQPCPPADDEEVEGDAKTSCYCSLIEPHLDKQWCQLDGVLEEMRQDFERQEKLIGELEDRIKALEAKHLAT